MLSEKDLDAYRTDGFVALPRYLDDVEVDLLSAEFERLLETPGPSVVYEKDAGAVRGHHGAHATSAVFADLVRMDRLAGVAEDILGTRVYVHQFKINAKRALVGDVWEWHQDFRFWHAEDGMPEPRAVNFGIFLDQVTEFNGPLTFIPGSQRLGLLDVEVRPETAWQDTLTSELRYRIPAVELVRALKDSSMVAPKGPRGSVLMFDSMLLHASAPNISPFDRRMVIITFNSVENTLRPVPEPRPEFIAARDFSPLHRIRDDALRRHAQTVTAAQQATPAW